MPLAPITLRQGPYLMPTASPGYSMPTLPAVTPVTTPSQDTPQSDTESPKEKPESVIPQPSASPKSSPRLPVSEKDGFVTDPTPVPSPPEQTKSEDAIDPPVKAPGSSTTILITPAPQPPRSDPVVPTFDDLGLPVITLQPGGNLPGSPDISKSAEVITIIPTTVQLLVQTGSIVPIPGSFILVGTQTVTPGQVITVGGTTTTLAGGMVSIISGTEISLDPQGTAVVIDRTSTVNIAPVAIARPTLVSPAVVTIGYAVETASQAPNGDIIVAGKTMTPGSAAVTFDGVPVSLAQDGRQLIVGESLTIILPFSTGPTIAPLAPPIIFTVGDATITARPAMNGGLIMGSQTLMPGNILTVDGVIMSLAREQNQLIVGGTSTILLPAPGASLLGPVIVTIGRNMLTLPRTSGPLTIGSQTLFPGSTIVLSGTTLSLAPSASFLVIGGTSTVQLAPSQATATSAPVIITINGKTLTADSLTRFVLDGVTLRVNGPAITVSGTTYTMATNTEGSTVLIAGTAGAITSTAYPTSTAAEDQYQAPGESRTIPASPPKTSGSDKISVHLHSGLTLVVPWLVVAWLLMS
jgi:archaellum component FlaF (FlaF/FlaG flagellin family)